MNKSKKIHPWMFIIGNTIKKKILFFIGYVPPCCSSKIYLVFCTILHLMACVVFFYFYLFEKTN